MSDYPILIPTTQIGFYERLREAEQTHLLPALLDQVGRLDIGILDRELLQYVGGERLAFVARYGLRGEVVYPVPFVLSSKPSLLGYYRLLLGFSQKEFYRGPFGRFRQLEDSEKLSHATEPLLHPLCESLVESAWLLVNGISGLSNEVLHSLTLLTLGPQMRGSRNVNLGVEAIRTVFALVKAIISEAVAEEGVSHFVVKSAAGRTYRIEFTPDPDIAIRQLLDSGRVRNRIAIEVKGGTDFSNVHNRLGEAEKSHQKARAEGFTEFWTVVNVANLDAQVWKQETPTTTEVFYLQEIADVRSQEHARFREYLISELGI